ncbi:MAG: hypothetical protein EA366_07000 [Spirulina sp. DLM2.Bin59]|nr:MAG: hypothetical protein EA366_07000 [Spirulina sp. DLM2.Bin59]
MSLEDQMIQDFIALVETQWPLFVDCQRELTQLCESLPEDKEAMSDAIAAWCESHPAIQNAIDVLSGNEISDGSKAPGTQGKAPPPPQDPKMYQEMLQNNIRRNQSPSQPKP